MIGTRPEKRDTQYWVIEVRGMEWLWLLNQMFIREKVAPEAIFHQFDPAAHPFPTLWIEREALTAEALGKALGRPAEDLNRAAVLRLRPLYNPLDFPLPNVPYYGTA